MSARTIGCERIGVYAGIATRSTFPLRATRGTPVRPEGFFHSLTLTLLTIAVTAVAVFDLYLLASGLG
jgi:hypothetical protein